MIQDDLTKKIITSIPAQKFLQPVIPEKQLIERKQLFQDRFSKDKNIIIVEGRAGAGKSVTAQQFLADRSTTHGWMQISDDDQDQVAFFTAFVVLLLRTFPDFKSQKVLPAVASNIIHPIDLIDFATTLMGELSDTPHTSDTYLVMDDLHLLKPSPESQTLLSTFVNKSPDWLKWILISRENIINTYSLDKIESTTLHIKETELDFTQHEIYQLFQNSNQINLTGDQVNSIFQTTQGWVMGTVLLALQNDSSSVTNASFTDNRKALFGEYFIKNILHSLSDQETGQFLQLMLLDEIDSLLAINILGQTNADTVFFKAIVENPFAKLLDTGLRLYSFHHLFSASMRSYAEQELSDKIIQKTLALAVDYYTEKGQAEAALRYAARCTTPSILEETIYKFGLELITNNHIRTLFNYLTTFSNDFLLERPTLSLYAGICYQEINPTKARTYLENSCTGFVKEGNTIGEIQARCSLIEFYTLIEGIQKKATDHIYKVEQIYLLQQKNLTAPIIAKAKFVLAFGYFFAISDMEKTKTYVDLTFEHCIENNLYNVLGSLSMIMHARLLFLGNWANLAESLENTHYLLHRPDVSHMGKVFIKLTQVNSLEIMGDFTNYNHQRNLLEQNEQQELIKQSILLPFLYIFDIDIAIAENRLNDALNIVDKGLTQIVFQKPHTRSQFLHYKALILAINGEVDQSLAASKEALETREQAGTPIFIMLTHQILGVAHLHLGLLKEAENHFAEVHRIQQDLNGVYPRAMIDAHFAYYWLKQDEPKKAKKPTENCLSYMRRKDHLHFFTWMPDVMKTVLSFAVKNDIEVAYAKKLLSERLKLGLDSSNKPTPLLKTSFLRQETESIESNIFYLRDLPRKQRQLLFTLFFRPNMKLSLAELNLLIWPEKEPANLRSSIDNLITSIRRSIAPIVGMKNAKQYVTVSKGEVTLKNWKVDGCDFLTHSKKGRTLATANKVWQAGNSFHKAFNLLPEEGLNRDIFQYAEEIEDFFMHELALSAKSYIDLLIADNNDAEALIIARKTYRLFPDDPTFSRKCYDIFATAKDTVGCQLILKNYENEYREIGASNKEVEEALKRFWE